MSRLTRNNSFSKAIRIITVFLPLLPGCIKEEAAVARHNSGDVKISAIDMSFDYRYQVFYSLVADSVVSVNEKTAWDLAFESSPDGFHVFLNESKSMFAQEKTGMEFSSVKDTNGFSSGKRWDVPSGNPDSTAIGNWTVGKPVYLIDRGFGFNGNHQGFIKIRFLEVDASSYTIQFSDLAGTQQVTMSIPKDISRNFTFLSFSNSGHLAQIEPPKNSWDLCFSQYLHVFRDPLTIYLVTGCLLNRNQTCAAVDSLNKFGDITYELAKKMDFSTSNDIIGYSWKSFADGSYTTRPELNYVIKDQKGVYYKLHFIDFYSNTGQKGSPKWELQRL